MKAAPVAAVRCRERSVSDALSVELIDRQCRNARVANTKDGFL